MRYPAICGAATLLLGFLFAAAAGAETRALLIGVSEYDLKTDGLTDLRGPANDVRLLREVLAGRGVSDIRMLADGVVDAARPTRAAILAAFDDLADRAQPGDFVYIHFSGHGTRQRDPEGDETDGLDEVFLPIDTGRAAPGSGLIPGAIVDDEIGRAVSAIRAKGADVWLVLDTCNSGSGLRGAGEGIATRFVDPAALGVSLAAAPRPDGVADGNVPDLPGGYLAFYAAKSSELAREVAMPAGTGEAWYGLFTAKLAARLADGVPVSFRQLFQAVLSDLNDSAIPGVARLQTPSWEGSLIDAAVFGGRATAGVRRFRVTGDEVAAGLVHGLAEGTVLGLVDDAAAPPDAVIGFAQMELVEPTRAVLRPVAEDCQPLAHSPCAAVGTLPAAAAYAQVVARPLDLVVRLSPVEGLDGAVPDAVAATLDAALAEAGLVTDARAYDVEVLWAAGQLWFGPQARIGDAPVGLAWTPEGQVPLAPLLMRIARAERLARTLAAVAAAASPLDPSPVKLFARVAAVNVADLSPDETPVRECRRAAAGAAPPQALAPGADLKQCDQLGFAVQGQSPGARDVNRVYIDTKYCIRVDHELVEDARAARRLGPDMTMCSDCPDGYGAGEERMFVIVTQAEENAEPLNLEGMLDNCSGAGATRGPAGRAALDLLTAQARRPGTRGSFGGFGAAEIWVEALNWRVLPRSEALRRFAPLALAQD